MIFFTFFSIFLKLLQFFFKQDFFYFLLLYKSLNALKIAGKSEKQTQIMKLKINGKQDLVINQIKSNCIGKKKQIKHTTKISPFKKLRK